MAKKKKTIKAEAEAVETPTPEEAKAEQNEQAEEVTKPRPNRKPRKPVPQDIKVSARQWCRIAKKRWEHCGGFLHRMKQAFGETKKTRPEWATLWDEHRNRVIR